MQKGEAHSVHAGSKGRCFEGEITYGLFGVQEGTGQARPGRLFPSLGSSPLQSRWLRSDTDCLMCREQIIHEKHNC